MSYPNPNILPADTKNRWKKSEVHEWYATLTEGQKSAFNQADKEFRLWLENSSQAWFGVSVTMSRINGEIRAAADKWNTAPGPMTYNAYRWLPNEL